MVYLLAPQSGPGMLSRPPFISDSGPEAESSRKFSSFFIFFLSPSPWPKSSLGGQLCMHPSLISAISLALLGKFTSRAKVVESSLHLVHLNVILELFPSEILTWFAAPRLVTHMSLFLAQSRKRSRCKETQR